jgi:hypothetical protein
MIKVYPLKSRSENRKMLTSSILHTEWSSGWGGQEIQILSESMAFTEKGYRVIIAGQPGGEILRHARDAGIPTLPFEQKNGPCPRVAERTPPSQSEPIFRPTLRSTYP